MKNRLKTKKSSLENIQIHNLKTPNFYLTISGVILISLSIILISLIQANEYSPMHRLFMLGLIVFVLISCCALIWHFYKYLRAKQNQIEILMGLKLALSSLIEMKDSYTEGHSNRVRNLTRSFSEYLCLPSNEVENISLAGELHDIGKIGIPDSILKKTEKINDSEYEIIKNHPKLGAESIRSIKGFEEIAEIILHHHEKHDGTGYPDNLKGNEIPLGARILSIVDAYDAMFHGRSYRKPYTKEKVLDIIHQAGQKQFDPALSMKFISFINGESKKLQADPVCGMRLSANYKDYTCRYVGQSYFFCSRICARKFEESPEKFILSHEID